VLFGFFTIVGMLIFFVVAGLTRKVSVASMVMAVSMATMIIFSGVPLGEALVVVGLTALVIVRHQSNIRRLLAGGERSWKSGS